MARRSQDSRRVSASGAFPRARGVSSQRGDATGSRAAHAHLPARFGSLDARRAWGAWLPPGFLAWVIARALAMVVLVAGGWLIYTASTSSVFEVTRVRVQGASLLGQADVEQAAAVIGANVFWVDRAAAEARLRSLPLVAQAEVTPIVPDTVNVRIVERQPAAFWVSDRTYVVDKDGVVLRPLGEDEGVFADQPLPTVAEADGRPLNPGDVVDATALATWSRLAALLPSVGIKPQSAQWSADLGLEVLTQEGWRARFDSAGGENLQRQVDSLRAIRDYLARTRTPAEVIDVRFGDRPYYR